MIPTILRFQFCSGLIMTLVDRLHNCYTGAVHDVLRERGLADFVLPKEINPIDPSMKAAGQVFTITGQIDRSASAHDTLLAWTGFLSKAPRDSVIVCQPNDDTIAHMGELSAEVLQYRGIRGYIVDGGSRDTDFICRIGFPTFCKYTVPIDVVGVWVPTGMGEPIKIGSVQINNGDYVIADRDGVVRIPGELAEEVTAAAEKIMTTENMVRKAILEGVDPQEAYLKFGKF
jgi:4-hydroxy-4-methyl-2-oxoglutarate aldolase